MSDVVVGKALIDLIVLAKKEGWLDKLRRAFSKRHSVLVTGSTGVGKSLFLKSLTEELPQAISIMNRTEFVESNKLKISDTLFDFIDTPGDAEKGDFRRAAFTEAVRSSTKVVLNVTAFGYHEHRTSTAADVFTQTGSVKADYLRKHRQVEIDYIDEWSDLLFDVGSAKTVITVATKADIWWTERQNVRSHYVDGGYGQKINSFAPEHIVKEYSGRTQKFYRGSVVSPDFDDDDRSDLRASIFTTLLNAVSQE